MELTRGLRRICARRSGINEGVVRWCCVYAELLASTFRRVAELCVVINAKQITHTTALLISDNFFY